MRIVLAFLLFFLLCSSVQSAPQVTLHPLVLQPQESVTLDVQGMKDGTSFSLLIESQFRPGLQGQFSFGTAQLVLPVLLRNGEISVYTEHTNWTGLSVKKGDTMISVSRYAVDGIFEATEAANVTPGTYEYIRIRGESLPGAEQITCRMQLNGEKEGPEAYSISFQLEGIEEGEVQIIAYSEGSMVLDEVVKVVPGPPPRQSGGTGAPPSSPILPTSTPDEGSLPSAPRSIFSVDERVRITTSREDVRILRWEEMEFPIGWTILGRPYAVVPENITFDPPLNLSFRLLDLDPEERTVFLTMWEGNDWRMLPSRIEEDTITAEIRRSGIYALAQLNETSTSTVPSIRPNLTKGESPPQTAPVPAGLLILALVVALLAFRRND